MGVLFQDGISSYTGRERPELVLLHCSTYGALYHVMMATR